MPQFDPNVPLKLRLLQQWFGSILKQPINAQNKLPRISPTGKNIEEEASEYVSPSSTLTAAKRLEIYYQQYWWRLLSTLRDTFPTLSRLFTFREAKLKLFIPYLIDYQPKHWDLNVLGKDLFGWMLKNYKEKDRYVVLAAVELDWAFQEIFYKEKRKPLTYTQSDISKLLEKPLKVQPHLSLFHFPFDFFTFRHAFLKESEEHWVSNDFPKLLQEKNNYFFMLFRPPQGNIRWEEIEEGEWGFLTAIQEGNSINEICKRVESEPDEVCEQSRTHLSMWIKKWIDRELFVK